MYPSRVHPCCTLPRTVRMKHVPHRVLAGPPPAMGGVPSTRPYGLTALYILRLTVPETDSSPTLL